MQTGRPEFQMRPIREIMDLILDEMERRMNRACQHVEGKVVELINERQPTRFANPRPGNQPKRVGLSPSLPGDPPKVLTAELLQSINYRVERHDQSVIGYIGANTEYARRLELGFVGTDAAGRRINQKPRPYLRRGVKEERKEIIRILEGK